MNRDLNRLLRGGGLTSFRVDGREAQRRDNPFTVFDGERHTFSASTMEKSYDFKKKENREEKKGGGDSGSGSDSGSDDDGPKKKKSKGIYKKGEDADKDGKTGEGKGKVTDFSDKNRNGKPDAFEKKK